MKVVSKEIEMIAHFENGKINPIKFRIESDNGYQIIRIGKVISIELEKLCGNKMWVFTCSALIEDVEKIFEIKYDIERCIWILFKI